MSVIEDYSIDKIFLDHIPYFSIWKNPSLSLIPFFVLREKFGWPMAILFLAPAEGWKGPSGPAGTVFLSLR